MKNFLLIVGLTIFAVSCKKQTIQDAQYKETQLVQTENFAVKLILDAYWYNLYKSCLPGIWYCWEIGGGSNISYSSQSRDFIKIDINEKLITFGIDYNVNTKYHQKFIQGNSFNFPQNTYIKSSIVKACIGLDKVIYVAKGLHDLKINHGMLIITAPYTILDLK